MGGDCLCGGRWDYMGFFILSSQCCHKPKTVPQKIEMENEVPSPST